MKIRPSKLILISLFSGAFLSFSLSANASFFDDFLTGFSEGFFSTYQTGFSEFSQLIQDYGVPAVEEALYDSLGELGLTDTLSIEKTVLAQAQRGEHVLRLSEAPRDRLGEIYGRRVAVDQAKVQAQGVLSEEGQARLVDKMILVQTNGQLATAHFEQADEAQSSQTAIKRLAALSLRNTELLAGLSTEIINGRVDDAVGLEVLTGVAEQLDESQTIHWAEQRAQVDALIRTTLGIPMTFTPGALK